MTWDEHEKEYGIVVEEIPNGIHNEYLRLYGKCHNYSSANNLIDCLDYEYEGRVCFVCVREKNGTDWFVIDKDDLEKLDTRLSNEAEEYYK